MNVREAIDILAARRGNHDFSSSLVRQYRERRYLSPKQEEWAVKLAKEAVAVEGAKAALPPATLADLWPAMPTPSGFLRWTDGRGGPTLQVRRGSGRRALFITVDNCFFGTVFPDGAFKGGVDMAEACRRLSLDRICDALVELAGDPKGALARYGRATGRCGVCGRELSDPESVALGIGPICLSRLP